MSLISLIPKKVARKVVEYSAVIFIQTILFSLIFLSFRVALIAAVAATSFVVCLIFVFEFFYNLDEDTEDDNKR